MGIDCESGLIVHVEMTKPIMAENDGVHRTAVGLWRGKTRVFSVSA